MRPAGLLLAALCLLAGCTGEAPTPLETEVGITEHTGADEVVIVVAGDLMVHEQQLRSAWNPASGSYDFTPSFERIAADIAAADLAVGNLETVLGGEPIGYLGYPRFNTPDSFATALHEAGFDFLTTANNHCLDQGEDGLLRTIEVLDRVGIGHTGTFSAGDGARAALVEANGMRIALVAFTYGVNDLPLNRPELVNRLDRGTVDAVMRAARAQQADWIIALPHMGEEYATQPEAVSREWADYLVACGADAVLAAHPHVLQSVEVRRSPTQGDKLIAYSLGNFLSFQQGPPCDTGMLLKIRIGKDTAGSVELRGVSILPVWTQHRDSSGRYPARVIPIYDAVYDYERSNSLGLRQQDYTRLLEAHEEVTRLFLTEAAGRHGMQREYELYPKSGSDNGGT